MPTTTPSYYSFFPYLRQGLSGLITQQDQTAPVSGYNERAKVSLGFNLNPTSATGATPPANGQITRVVELKGPGDITGINSSAILKVSPANWVTNMEPNYLPYIEFYDEDFPWRYTPAAAKLVSTGVLRLRPWVSLVVLEEGEFDDTLPFNGIVSTIKIENTSCLPANETMWAWAHVHVNKDITGGNASTTLKAALDANPDIAVSRLLCPRKLKPNTSYHAFLIPTFETGRLAGIGSLAGIANTNALMPSWGASPANTGTVEFPVYHKWFFKTGNAGDFESLVRLLQPRTLPEGSGKRLVDLQRSGNPSLESVPAPRPTIDMEGIVKPLDILSDDWNISNPYPDKMKNILNTPTDYIANANSADPVIAPPIYGRWHAAVDKVYNTVNASTDDSGKWVNKANLDPRYRLFAGIGAEVIRKNQEEYMQIAWEQVGEVMEANRKMRQLQLSEKANIALHNKHIKKLGTLSGELLLNMAAPLHTKIKAYSSAPTVYKNIKESVIPSEMFTGAFRRLTRPKGPLLSSINAGGTSTTSTATLISDVNNNNVAVTLPYQTGQINGNSTWSGVYTASVTINGMSEVVNFELSSPGSFVPVPVNGSNSATTQSFVEASGVMNDYLLSLTPYQFTTAPSLDIPTASQTIALQTDPKATIKDLAKKTINIPGYTAADWNANSIDKSVMATPKIKIPMYKELAAQSPDWMMPGLNNIASNSISLLKSDQKYIEAYMLGLNHEMARELLWRGYPTDQRGTCFSFFWGYNNANISSVAELNSFRDIADIHTWKAGSQLKSLGANTGRSSNGNLLVLTIRGELLRKYPGAMVYLQKAKWDSDANGLTDTKHRIEDTSNNGYTKYPIFSAHVEPDIYFLGFEDVTAEQIKGGAFNTAGTNAGYFFVFQERAGELHFGADIDMTPPPTTPAANTIPTWDDLNWGRIVDNPLDPKYIDLNKTFGVTNNTETVTWSKDSSSVAYALLQSPVRLLVHGSGLIK